MFNVKWTFVNKHNGELMGGGDSAIGWDEAVNLLDRPWCGEIDYVELLRTVKEKAPEFVDTSLPGADLHIGDVEWDYRFDGPDKHNHHHPDAHQAIEMLLKKVKKFYQLGKELNVSWDGRMISLGHIQLFELLGKDPGSNVIDATKVIYVEAPFEAILDDGKRYRTKGILYEHDPTEAIMNTPVACVQQFEETPDAPLSHVPAGKLKFRHYHPANCPSCGAGLCNIETIDKSSIKVACACAGQVIEFNSHVGPERGEGLGWTLADSDNLVWNGYHSCSTCVCCGEYIPANTETYVGDEVIATYAGGFDPKTGKLYPEEFVPKEEALAHDA
jgi:hypothetical protein